MEFIEVQSDIQLKEKFDNYSLLDFNKLYLPKEKYLKLQNHALFLSSLFGSTCICEEIFSRMKYTKNKTRIKISDHLENLLKIVTTCIKPNIEALLSKKVKHLTDFILLFCALIL